MDKVTKKIMASQQNKRKTIGVYKDIPKKS